MPTFVPRRSALDEAPASPACVEYLSLNCNRPGQPNTSVPTVPSFSNASIPAKPVRNAAST